MRRTWMLSLTLLAVAGCQPINDVTDTGNRDVADRFGSDAAGIYVLRTVQGNSLPAVVASHASYHAVMLADTIYLHADGWGGDAAVKRVTEDPAAGERVVRDDGAFTYEISGGRLTGEFPCNDVIVLAACAAPPHLAGTLSANGLELDVALSYRLPLRYVKVGGPSDVAAIRIGPADDLSLAVGATLQLVATPLDAQGRSLSARSASWRSIPSSHATVSGGTVRGVARGTAYVIAFIDGRTDTVRVQVR